jgi:hypothetical protein
MEIESTKLPDWVAQRIVESQEITQDLAIEEPMFFDNQSLTLHNTQYKRHEKKLQIERVSVKHKKVVHKLRSVVDVSGVAPSELMQLHHSIGDALADSISEQELQTIKLKKRISELEEALSPRPLFAQPLAILSAEQTPPSTPGISRPIRKALQLLNGVRLYVVDNINKRLDIIRQAWEVNTSLRDLSQRILSFTRDLQRDLQHDEAYCKNELNTFVAWVTSISDHRRNQQGLPNSNRIRKIKAGWEQRVKMLQDAIVACKKIDERRGDVILKAFDVVKEMQGPQLFINSTMITKEELNSHLVAMKTSLASDFDNLVEFPEEELKQWLVTFVNDNEEHLSAIEQLQLECKEMEDHIFVLQVKQEITIPPIKTILITGSRMPCNRLLTQNSHHRQFLQQNPKEKNVMKADTQQQRTNQTNIIFASW